MTNKSQWVKKYTRADTQKMKSGKYHNTGKGDSKKMRRNKKKDINKRINEASMTTTIRGYLSGMKKQAASKGTPWYLKTKALSESLIMEDSTSDVQKPDFSKQLAFYLKSGDAWEWKGVNVNGKNVKGVLQAKDLDDLKAKLAQKGVNVVDAQHLGKAKTPDEASKAFEMRHPEMMGVGDRFKRSKDVPEIKTRGLGSGYNARLGQQASNLKDEYFDELHFIIDILSNKVAKTPEDQVKLDRAKQLASTEVPDMFWKTHFGSYPQAYVSDINEFLRSKKRPPVNEKTAERGDQMARLLAEKVPPQLIMQFVNYFNHNTVEIKDAEDERREVLATTGGNGVRGDFAKGFGAPDRFAKLDSEEDEESQNVDDHDIQRKIEDKESQLASRGFSRDRFNPIKGLEDVDISELENGPPENEDDEPRERSNLRMPDEQISNLFGKPKEEELDIGRSEDPHVKDILDKASQEGFDFSKAKEFFEPWQLQYLASKALLNGAVQKKAAIAVSNTLLKKKLNPMLMAAQRDLQAKGLQGDDLNEKLAGVKSSLEAKYRIPPRVVHKVMMTMMDETRTPLGHKYKTISRKPNLKNLPPQLVEDDDFGEIVSTIWDNLNPARVVKRAMSQGRGAHYSPIENYLRSAVIKRWKDARQKQDEQNARAESDFGRRNLEKKRHLSLAPDKLKDAVTKKKKKFSQGGVVPTKDNGFVGTIAKAPRDINHLKSRISDLEDRLEKLVWYGAGKNRDKISKLKEKIDKLKTVASKQEEAREKVPFDFTSKPHDDGKEKENKPSKSKGSKKGNRSEKAKSQAKKDSVAMWRKAGLSDPAIKRMFKKKWGEELVESKLSINMKNFKALVARDLKSIPNLAEMLLSAESTDKEEEVEVQNKSWEKASPQNKKNFYKKLSLETLFGDK